MMQIQLSTDRLEVQPLSEAYWEFVMALVNSRGWLQFIGDRNVHSKEDAIAYIQKVTSLPDFNYYVVTLKTTGEALGIISFIKRDYLPHHDLGFAFLPTCQGQRYAKEAAAALLQYVKETAGHTVILATTLPENISSIKLLEKLGFRFDKALRVGDQLLRLFQYS